MTSLFAELVYLAGNDEDPALRTRHRQVFARWLALPLAEQAAEFMDFLEATGDDRLSVLRCWIGGDPAGRLIPKEARKAERLLFQSDLEITVSLACAECALLQQTEPQPYGSRP